MPKTSYINLKLFKNLNYNFLVYVLMEINNLDHAIEFSTKKYPKNRVFVHGGEKWWAPAPNPTVQK